MTDRDRLIELINQVRGNEIALADYEADILVDYLLANDVIVPPCKVGDTVYYYCETFGVLLPYFVENLNIAYLDKNRQSWQYEANCTNIEEDELLDSIDFDLDDIGRTYSSPKRKQNRF